MAGGSNPSRRTISNQNPIKPWFVEVLEYQNTTLLQLYKDFISTDKSYLQQINNIYYLVYKYNGKIIKKSLRSSNLKHCNIKKLKMINIIKKELGLGFDKVGDMLKIVYITEEGDDLEEVERLKEEAFSNASKSIPKGKIKSISTDEYSKVTIEEALNLFIKYTKSTNQNISDSTLENYNSAMAYIKLFISEKESIAKLSSSFWIDLQENLALTPRDYLKIDILKERNIHKVIYDNEELKQKSFSHSKNKKLSNKDSDEVMFKIHSKIYSTLSHSTINKHFSFYKRFMEYIEKKGLMINTIKVEALEEKESKKETFLYRELRELFDYKLKRKDSNGYDNEEYQNIFKFAFLTGMRRGEILKIDKDSIVRVNNILCIDVKISKTEAGVRLVPISEDMKKIMDIQFKKSKNGYLFFDKDIREDDIKEIEKIERTIGKRLNRKIDSMLVKNGYADKSVKSFHSLRGNFVQELYKKLEKKEIGSELYIKTLVGHKEASRNVTFKNYNKSEVGIDILRDCIYEVTISLVTNSIGENIVEKIKVNNVDLVFS